MRELELAGLASVDGLRGPSPVAPEDRDEGVKHAALHGECLNCGEALHGRFCARCGQTADDHHRSIWTLVWEWVEDVTHLDGRLAKTLPALFIGPGKLARDHFEGRRQRHVPPFRMFLIALLLFMLSLETMFQGSPSAPKPSGKAVAPELGQVITTTDRHGRTTRVVVPTAAQISSWTGGMVTPEQIEKNRAEQAPKPETPKAQAPAKPATVKPVDDNGEEVDDDAAVTAVNNLVEGRPGDVGRIVADGGTGNVTAKAVPKVQSERMNWVAQHIAKARANPAYFKAVAFEWAHRLAVLLLPIFALLLTAMYFYKRQFFVYDHLIVSMHFLSFVFLLWALAYILPQPVKGVMMSVAFFWPPVNLFLTLRGGYGSSRIGAAVKAFTLWIASMTLFALLVVGILAMAVGQL